MDTPQVVICRRASDPLKPGSVLGYNCAACGRAVAVSPYGLPFVQEGKTVLCNPCGMDLADKLAKQMESDPTKKATVLFTPAAMANAADQGIDVEQWCKENGVPVEKEIWKR